MVNQKQNAVEQDARFVARIETTVDDTLLLPLQAMTALENAGITGGIVERRLQDLPQQLMPMIQLR